MHTYILQSEKKIRMQNCENDIMGIDLELL